LRRSYEVSETKGKEARESTKIEESGQTG